MTVRPRPNREKALEKIRQGNYHSALHYLDSEEDMELYGELERFADMVSNYEDRFIRDLAKKINEVSKEEKIRSIINEAENMTSAEINRAMGHLSTDFSVKDVGKDEVRERFEEFEEQ